MKLSKRALVRWSLVIIVTATLIYCALPLIFGRVSARHHFTDNNRHFTVIIREMHNDGWPIDGLAWLGIFSSGRHAY